MPFVERVFDNFFEDPRITPARLYNCSNVSLQRLINGNTDNVYEALITMLQPAVNSLGNELNDVTADVAVQRGATLTVENVMQNFKDTMSAKEGVIADALGGRNTPAYIEFYPHGITGYRSATKTNIEALTASVKQAATKYLGTLSPALVTLLQSFYDNYKDARNAQQQTVASVEDNRSTRTNARITLEMAMLVTVHTIGSMYPEDATKCMSLFDFSLLYPNKHEHEILKGLLAPNEIKVVLNRMLDANDRLILMNTDENASIIVYLALTADEQPNGQSIEIKPGKKIEVKASELGNLNNTFLLAKNMSGVNEGSYKVEAPLMN